jgi:short-subunit dehydrogenase
MADSQRPLALVTGASSGIGFHLAQCCAENGYDLLIAADGEAPIDEAAAKLREAGAQVDTVQVDLATPAGVQRTYEAAKGRPIAALLANAGHGLGQAFVDQSFDDIRHVIETNVTGTLDLVHRVARDMRQRGEGRILFTGSIAGTMPGTYQAVYNGTKAFIDSFAIALRHELKDAGVSVTLLMPGVTDTRFFERAGLTDTEFGQSDSKDDPADVARKGFEAMQKGESHIVTGLKNKAQVAMTNVLSDDMLAEMHAKQAKPGSGDPAQRH